MAINRRDFIKQSALITGGLLIMPSCFRSMGMYRFFTYQEAKCIIAVCEQIIPRDESPGATDAGVIYYIDRQLSGVFHYDTLTYRNGIKDIQQYCQAKYSNNFEDINQTIQFEILNLLESGQITFENGGASAFFNLVRNHTMQGFYGSPIHGGNKDYVSFNMLRLDYPLIIGQNRYKN